jgi:hypothetical protein
MMEEVIIGQKIDRTIIDLQIVLIDDIKLNETFSEFDKEIKSDEMIKEEAENFKYETKIKTAKKESCCYRWCNCICCYKTNNNKINDDIDNCGDNCFWYWYFSDYRQKSSSHNNNCCNCRNNHDDCCHCDCDCDCDDD